MLLALASNAMFGAEPSPVTGVDNSSGRIQSIANRRIKMDRAAIAGTFPFGLIARNSSTNHPIGQVGFFGKKHDFRGVRCRVKTDSDHVSTPPGDVSEKRSQGLGKRSLVF